MEANRNQNLEFISKFILFARTVFERFSALSIASWKLVLAQSRIETIDFIGFSSLGRNQQHNTWVHTRMYFCVCNCVCVCVSMYIVWVVSPLKILCAHVLCVIVFTIYPLRSACIVCVVVNVCVCACIYLYARVRLIEGITYNVFKIIWRRYFHSNWWFSKTCSPTSEAAYRLSIRD